MTTKLLNVLSKNLTLFVFFLLLSACSIKLAPNYDESLYVGITQVNVEIMELLSSVSTGAESGTFNKREATYNSVIGKVDALAIQSEARSVPENTNNKAVNEYLKLRGVNTISNTGIPSVSSLKHISKNLSKMKEKDREKGLGVNAVAAFRNEITVGFDQALFYEGFLKR